MTSNTQSTYEIYDPRDPQKQNIERVLAFVPAGTHLVDCFGSGFVVVDGKEDTKKPQRPVDELGGPRFI